MSFRKFEGFNPFGKEAAGGVATPFDSTHNFNTTKGTWGFTDVSPGSRWTGEDNETPSSGSGRTIGPLGPYEGSRYVFWEGSSSTGVVRDNPLEYDTDITLYTGLRIEFAYCFSVAQSDGAGGTPYPRNTDVLFRLEALVSGGWQVIWTGTKRFDETWYLESVSIPDAATKIRFNAYRNSADLADNTWNTDPSIDGVRVTNQP